MQASTRTNAKVWLCIVSALIVALTLSCRKVPDYEFVTQEMPMGHTGVAYDTTIEVHGESSNTTIVISGSLPPGLNARQVATNRLRIQGTPSLSGTFPFTATATTCPPGEFNCYTIQRGFSVQIL